MEGIKNIDKKLLVAVGLLGIAGIGWFALNRIKNNKINESINTSLGMDGTEKATINTEQ